MKLKILPLLLILFGFGLQQVAAQDTTDNLLLNGNFADGFTEWTLLPEESESRFELRQSPLENGQTLYYVGGGLNQIFSAFVSAEAGKEYIMRVHTRVFGTHGDGANMKLIFADPDANDGEGDRTGEKEIFLPEETEGEWVWSELTMVAPENTKELQVELANWNEGENLEVFIDEVQVKGITGTDIENEMSEVPKNFDLRQNYPNPFNPSTQIEFSVAEYSNVTLEVFNIVGQKVATLIDGDMSAGIHEVKFDAGDLPSGTYMYRLEADDYKEVRKMMLVK